MGRSALPKTAWQHAWHAGAADNADAVNHHAEKVTNAKNAATQQAADGARAKKAASANRHAARVAETVGKVGKHVAGAPRQGSAMPGAVRIIGGLWKRRKLPVAQGQGIPAGLRPTADRVRETLFNWLGQDLSGWRCVDVCAGTGALGFEAASRGAAHVALVEQHPAILQHLHAACKALGAQTVHIIAGDGLQYLRQQAVQAPRSVDAIFFDPPYGCFSTQQHHEALRAAAVLLAGQGCFYLESDREWSAKELADLGWERWRYLKAGAVHAHLLRMLCAPVQGVEA